MRSVTLGTNIIGLDHETTADGKLLHIPLVAVLAPLDFTLHAGQRGLAHTMRPHAQVHNGAWLWWTFCGQHALDIAPDGTVDAPAAPAASQCPVCGTCQRHVQKAMRHQLLMATPTE